MTDSRQTIRPSEARKILGISRNTFDKWVKEGILPVAGRLPGTPKSPMGERRFYLNDVFALEKEIMSTPK